MTEGRSDKRWVTLADILVQCADISETVLHAARKEADEKGVRLEVLLRQKGLISEQQLVLAVAQYLGIVPVDLSHGRLDEEFLRTVPRPVIDRYRAIPLAKWGSHMAVVMQDPFDLDAQREIEALTRCSVSLYVAPESQVAEALEKLSEAQSTRLEDVLSNLSEVEPEFESDMGDEPVDTEQMLDLSEDEPVVRIVNSILIEALRVRASDIHVEPMPKTVQVRYRIDGVLYDQPCPPKHMQWPLVSRLKIISRLDIAERRLPQDGRFTIRALGKEADVRVSIIPTIYGEKVVLRILDKANLGPNIASLGLEKDAYEKLTYAVRQPHGMILVTGPTGSGKTTTLYSALQELNKPGVNIITIEDPVEYQLERVNQIHVKPEIGLTFATGLRAILRQDPDIVMVGEIRDRETATIAVEAAMTGHLVLSTLHTNDAAGAIARLLHMGIEPFLIASSLIMTQAQRIYRKLCPVCKQRRSLPMDVLRLNAIDPSLFGSAVLFQPRGCPRCGGIGYSGREAIMEILPVDDDVRELIVRQVGANEIRRQSVAKGMLTLRDVGLLRVKRGSTSLEEILRVTSHA